MGNLREPCNPLGMPALMFFCIPTGTLQPARDASIKVTKMISKDIFYLYRPSFPQGFCTTCLMTRNTEGKLKIFTNTLLTNPTCFWYLQPSKTWNLEKVFETATNQPPKNPVENWYLFPLLSGNLNHENLGYQKFKTAFPGLFNSFPTHSEALVTAVFRQVIVLNSFH